MTTYREYKQVLQNIVDAEEMIKRKQAAMQFGRNGQAELKDAEAEKEEYEEN